MRTRFNGLEQPGSDRHSNSHYVFLWGIRGFPCVILRDARHRCCGMFDLCWYISYGARPFCRISISCTSHNENCWERQLVSASNPLFDGYEAVAGIPQLRLPTGFQIIDSLRRAAPSFSAFNQALEGGKAPERYRDGAFDLQRIQLFGDGSVEEGAVDAGLDTCAGKAPAHLAHTVVDEGTAPLESRTFPGR